MEKKILSKGIWTADIPQHSGISLKYLYPMQEDRDLTFLIERLTIFTPQTPVLKPISPTF